MSEEQGSMGAKGVTVLATLAAAIISGGWLLERGAREPNRVTPEEGTRLFRQVLMGQAFVEFAGVTTLPPSGDWSSGLVPYPLLLVLQIVILGAMARLNAGVTLRRGFFTRQHPRLGTGLAGFAAVYAAVMIARYLVSGQLHPQRRFWPPATIPVAFHLVLAGYLYALSRICRRPV